MRGYSANPKRGEIYFVEMPKHRAPVHSCMKGYRPVVVVSSPIGNESSDIVMVCPITTKIKHHTCNVDIGWSMDGRPSQVLCNQITTIPQAELAHRRGCVTPEEQLSIDIAMFMSLGINIGGKNCAN